MRVYVEPPSTTHSGAGICYRTSDDGADYLAFVATAGRGASLLRKSGSRLRVLWSGETTVRDEGSFVTLKVVGRGPTLWLYLDDKLIYTKRGVDLLSGNPGIMAYSLGCFVFDDFVMSIPTDQ